LRLQFSARASALVGRGLGRLTTPSLGGVSAVRVVIADDEPAFLDALHALIEGQSKLSVVGSAGDGLEAVELVDQLEPDAVVIDLHMPRLDGVSAIRRLRLDHPQLCLIALTGDPDPGLHRAANEAGADAVLLKGELVETLLERLRAVGSRGSLGAA
jgi:two-component system nitrate/nitrite response regulator NarL